VGGVRSENWNRKTAISGGVVATGSRAQVQFANPATHLFSRLVFRLVSAIIPTDTNAWFRSVSNVDLLRAGIS
jgi:hypothetical protein